MTATYTVNDANLTGKEIAVANGQTLTLTGSTQIGASTSVCGGGSSFVIEVGGVTYNASSPNSFTDLNDKIQACLNDPGCSTLEEAIVLPVTLLSYVATLTKTGIDLAWVTQDETDNELFTVERSRDGRVFTEIAEVRGQGTTASATEYGWTDAAPRAGSNFYRLSQTDFDGTHTVLGVVSVDWTGRRVTITPNPVAAGSSILLDLDEETAGGRAELISFDGRRVFTIQLGGAEGRRAQLPLELPRGVYLLRVPGTPEIEPTKLIVE